MKKYLIAVAVMIVSAAGFVSCSNSHYVVRSRPEPVVVVRPAAPSPRHVWVNGNYVLRGGRYVWQDGYWIVPQNNRHWRDGYWKSTRRGWVWVPGRWR